MESLNLRARPAGDERERRNEQKEKERFIADLQTQANTLAIAREMIRSAGFRGGFVVNFRKKLKTLERMLHEMSSGSTTEELRASKDRAIRLIGEVIQEAEIVLDAEPTLAPVRHNDGPTTSIRILFLTDLHWGAAAADWMWPTFQDKFFQDLRWAHEQCGTIDLVIFTGDLVFAGTPEQYREFNEVLRLLWEKLKILGSDPVFLSIPGNHDLVRPSESDGLFRLVAELVDMNSSASQSFWDDRLVEVREFIKGAFREYDRWQESNLALQQSEGKMSAIDYCKGILPGDFSYTLRKEGKSLGIVGLNSTWLQLKRGDYKRKLVIHPKQLHALCGGNGPQWTRHRDACILLTHQPADWFADRAKELFDTDIYTNGCFFLHANGHNHSSQFRQEGERLYLQGASLFGLRECDGNVERQHGYCIIEVVLSKKIGAFRFWPRIRNGANIVADTRFVEKDWSDQIPISLSKM